MGAYHSHLTRTASATDGVSLLQPGSGMRRALINDLVFGYSGAVTDVGFAATLQRSTTAGTGGTAGVPQARDPGDPAALLVNRHGAATDGTKTADAHVFDMAGNMRSTIRWVAKEGSEIVIPGTAANGVHLTTPTTPTVAYSLGLTHVE